MERESFENTEIADFLRENFVSIKVDREERPDVDRVYMQASPCTKPATSCRQGACTRMP